MDLPKKRTAITAAIAGVGTAGVLGIALASSPAQAEDPTTSPSSSASAPANGRADRDADRAERQDERAPALAKDLGIDKAKVAAALEKVETARQAQAGAARAAELKTRLDAAVKA